MSLIRVVFMAFLAASVIASPVAAEDERLFLPPSSNWVLDYAEDNCALRRNFGDGEHSVRLEVRKIAPGDDFQVWLTSASLSLRLDEDDDISDMTVSWLPNQDEFTRGQVAKVELLSGDEGVVYQDRVRVPLPEGMDEGYRPGREEYFDLLRSFEGEITGYSIGGAFTRDVVLQTGAMADAFDALRMCMDDLLTTYGIDPEVTRNLTREARPRGQDRWAAGIRSRMPTNIYRERTSAFVRALVIVEPDGSVSSCRIAEPIVPPEYEERTCGIFVDRARYRPALDAEGEPVRSAFLHSIVYIGGRN